MEKSLNLLDGIYEKVVTRAASFLSPDEITKFGEFRKQAIGGNRMMLAMNRKRWCRKRSEWIAKPNKVQPAQNAWLKCKVVFATICFAKM